MSTGNHHFSFRINDRDASTGDRTPSPDQLLGDAGFEPADDFVLIQRTAHGTAVMSSDDSLDLGDGNAEFYAFPSGRIFELRVNEHSIFWGSEEIDIALVRKLGNVPDDDDLVWMRVDPGNETLPRQGKFFLGTDGIEHLRTHKRPPAQHIYRYYVDSTEFTTEHAQLTGAQITARLPEWNPENSLVLEGQGSEADEVIHPTTIVVFEGRASEARFTIVPPATFGAA